jgi:hypothetical protein
MRLRMTPRRRLMPRVSVRLVRDRKTAGRLGAIGGVIVLPMGKEALVHRQIPTHPDDRLLVFRGQAIGLAGMRAHSSAVASTHTPRLSEVRAAGVASWVLLYHCVPQVGSTSFRRQ